jgi:hypothetical protein
MLLGLGGGGCSEGGTSGVDWAAGTPATPAGYTPGTPVLLAQATIDPAGGTLEGPAGSPLEGVVVTFPAGAVAAPTVFHLGHDQGGSFANVPGDELPTLVLVLESEGQHEFGKALRVEFPFTDPQAYPVPYHLTPEGAFRVLEPLPLDRQTGRAGFLTWHASNFTWKNKLPASGDRVFFNGFRPGSDGFAFANTIRDEYAPGGRCVGISAFTKWYKLTHGGGLYSMFTGVVPSKAKDRSITAQEVLATRTHLSTALAGAGFDSLPPAQAVVSIQDALMAGEVGVQIGVSGNGDHALLAIGFSDNQIAVYDSNWPGQWKAIDYAFSLDGKTATIEYGDWNEVNLMGDPPQIEGFASMLRDAKAGFHGENQTQIEVTSHENGEEVSEYEVQLEGKIHSGQVRIEEIRVQVEYEDGSWGEEQTEELGVGQEDFQVALELVAGENRIHFKTSGKDMSGSLVDIPNDKSKDEQKFVLKLPPEGPQGTFDLVQTSTLGTFNIHGQVELFYNGQDDPDGGNGDYLDYVQWTMRGSAFMQTPSLVNPDDGKPCVLSGPGEQPIPAGVVFRVLKEDPLKARWLNFQLIWEYECEGEEIVGVVVPFQTRKGAMCAQLAEAVISDLAAPSGSFTMDCMQALQPAIGTIQGTWTLHPRQNP